MPPFVRALIRHRCSLMSVLHVCCRRGAADKLGGFWKGWTDIPVDVINNVSDLVVGSSAASALSDALLGSKSDSSSAADNSREAVSGKLKAWIDKEGDKALLEILFQAVHGLDLFEALARKMDELIVVQESREGV